MDPNTHNYTNSCISSTQSAEFTSWTYQIKFKYWPVEILCHILKSASPLLLWNGTLWAPCKFMSLAHWTRTQLEKRQNLLWQVVCQLIHEQKQDWVALQNKPIWILLSPEHIVSLISWKVSVLSIRARWECEETPALGDNCCGLGLEEEDLPSASPKWREWAWRGSHDQGSFPVRVFKSK